MFNYKFYITAVGGSFSILHRATHHFLESVDTEKELKERMQYYINMSDKDLWIKLLKGYVTIPKRNQSFLAKASDPFKEQEYMLAGAWSKYTDYFYAKNPKLLVEDVSIPYELIRDIRIEQSKAEAERMDREIKQAQENWKNAKPKEKVEEPEEVDVIIGSQASVQTAKQKLAKVKKKLKLKKKVGNKVLEFNDTDDVFM